MSGMNKIGCHAVYEKDYPEAIRIAADFGFDFVQVDLNVPRFYVEKLSRGDLRIIKSMLADTGVRLSFHAPGDIVGLFADYPRIREGIIDHFKMILDAAADLDARHVTVHPLQPPSFRRADTGKDDFGSEYSSYYSGVLESTIGRLAEYSPAVLICVENQKFSAAAADALSRLLPVYTNVRLTLDIPKMLRPDLGPDPAQEVFYTVNRRYIAEVHLHDMDIENRSHLLLGTGAVDYGEFLGRYLNPDAWITLEVRPVSEAAASKRLLEISGILK